MRGDREEIKFSEGKGVLEDERHIGSYNVQENSNQISSDEGYESREWARQGSNTSTAKVDAEG